VRTPRGPMVRKRLRGNASSSPTATYVLRPPQFLPSTFFTVPLRNSSLFLLLPRTYPYPNPWLLSTLPILPSHHHHHHTPQSPPFHLTSRPPPPSLQQNLVLHLHPTKMVPHLESGLGLTRHQRSERRPAPIATELQPSIAATSAKHNMLPWRLA
jgi:hypothetical protein